MPSSAAWDVTRTLLAAFCPSKRATRSGGRKLESLLPGQPSCRPSKSTRSARPTLCWMAITVYRSRGKRAFEYISAYVTEVHTRVPLSPDTQPDELIVKAEAVAFLESTRLDQYCSATDLAVSIPGQYDRLENHIEVHRYLIEEQEGHEISFEEAACRWYHEAYLPVVQVIREQCILRDFPGPHRDRSLSVDFAASRGDSPRVGAGPQARVGGDQAG